MKTRTQIQDDRAAVLHALQADYADLRVGIRHDDLQRVGGLSTEARIGELRDAGWMIRTSYDGDGVGRYHLTADAPCQTQADKRTHTISGRWHLDSTGKLEVRPMTTATRGDLAERMAERITVLMGEDPVLRDLLRDARGSADKGIDLLDWIDSLAG